MVELDVAQVRVDLFGVVVAQLRIALIEGVEVEHLGWLDRHRFAVAARLLLLELLLLRELPLTGGALSRDAHVGRLRRDAPPRALRRRELRGVCSMSREGGGMGGSAGETAHAAGGG